MTQILETTRRLPVETLSFEAPLGVSTAGAAGFASEVSFEANVVEFDGATKEGAEFVTDRSGQQYRIRLTLIVKGDAPVVPPEGSRITRGTRRYIAFENQPVSGVFYLASQRDHTRIRCRDE